MSEDNSGAEVGRNSGHPKEPLRPEAQDFSIKSAPELALYLIMCLPEECDRLQRVRDFVRLYHIEEKRPAQPRMSLEGEAPTWSNEQRKAIDQHEQGMRGLNRIANCRSCRNRTTHHVGCSPLRLAIFLSLRDPVILTVWKPEIVTAQFFGWLAPQAVPGRLLCCPKTAGSLPRPGDTNVSGRPVSRRLAAGALHNDAGFTIFCVLWLQL